MSAEADSDRDLSINIRRIIPTTPQRVFNAWTKPEIIKRWWGPTGVECIAAEVDLRAGGHYRIGNRMPDQRVLWISGYFEVVEPPRLLVYSWLVESGEYAGERAGDAHITAGQQRVTVHFGLHAEGTELHLLHEYIPTVATRDDHARGWIGCLAGLSALFKVSP